MNGIQFANPEYALLLWAVLAVAFILLFLELRGGRDLSRFIKLPMQKRLVDQLSPGRRFASLALLILSLGAIVIALMRPQWGVEFIKTPQVGAEIMIAIDVSRSMLAEDVAPNRLERAKAEIRDLLPYLEGDQVGLIAFAGRATVLCPLTPDFGFLRLVLDHIHVGSVAQGGTRLEEPIRKATEGFGSTGDLARVLLFFTDGEDHDSFPVDAAQKAAERGIQIVVIGFGDENGSEIWVTDPSSGARTRILDSEGRPAISRLDGTLLRELALVTEGAYVPAGTGVLDLESIFQAHIQPLMRGEGESADRTVQKDGFGWALMVALLALLGHVFISQKRRWASASLALALLIAPTQDSGAQSHSNTLPSVDKTQATNDEHAQTPHTDSSILSVPHEPREAYNEGIVALDQGKLDGAEKLFEAARRNAKGDGQLRFQATFNQSWVEVERAESNLEDDPASSLQSLERATDWLREAIALRPKNETARLNLEILLKRALLLSDALAEKTPLDIPGRLDALIENQRKVTRSIRQVASQAQDPLNMNPSEASRAEFKGVAVEERTLLTETGQLTQAVGDELKRLQQKAESERTPEEAMQVVGLEGVLHYLHRARERIGQARVQLRRRQAARAHRRASAGLFELKRAREQLMGPVPLIEGLITDNQSMAQETTILLSNAVDLDSLSGQNTNRPVQTPAWLNLDYLSEAALSLTERATELNTKLSMGIHQNSQTDNPEEAKTLKQLSAAQPHVETASNQLAEATDALRMEQPDEALPSLLAALSELIEAREQFLDLRGLIEAAWSDESRIAELLRTQETDSLAEWAEAMSGLQERNLERANRIAELLEEKRTDLASKSSQQESPSRDEIEAEQKRLELADGILALVESAMRGALDPLSRMGEVTGSHEKAEQRVSTAVRGLEGLRRLFFSVIEHLKEVARFQFELGDETEEMAGRALSDRVLGPLEQRQQQLAERSESLADTLHEQSFAQPEQLVGQQAAQDPAAAQEAAEKLARASELVLMASQDMMAAADGLEKDMLKTDEYDLEPVRIQQDKALEKIQEALAVLEPPQPKQDEEEQEPEEQEQQEKPSPSEGASQPEQEKTPQEEVNRDPNQLLQAVRDREAERHRRKQQEDTSGYNPIEKDW